ncbi:MAG: hypothetical protein JRH17_12010 [Deltaproteobacteria bacterium]|nr:hypothetical protein [Deltaproteobacteria bacterium]
MESRNGRGHPPLSPPLRSPRSGFRDPLRLAREIERQFVENDLVVAGGKRRGQPLTAEGRRRRIAQLLSLHDEQHRIDAQLQRLGAELESMNTDLEAWARDTYGLGR